jgi:hypothetical protein
VALAIGVSKNESLRKLNLQMNSLDQKSSKEFMIALQMNYSIQYLNLEDNLIDA